MLHPTVPRLPPRMQHRGSKTGRTGTRIGNPRGSAVPGKLKKKRAKKMTDVRAKCYSWKSISAHWYDMNVIFWLFASRKKPYFLAPFFPLALFRLADFRLPDFRRLDILHFFSNSKIWRLLWRLEIQVQTPKIHWNLIFYWYIYKIWWQGLAIL